VGHELLDDAPDRRRINRPDELLHGTAVAEEFEGGGSANAIAFGGPWVLVDIHDHEADANAEVAGEALDERHDRPAVRAGIGRKDHDRRLRTLLDLALEVTVRDLLDGMSRPCQRAPGHGVSCGVYGPSAI
jgi:hypothetical protein